MGPFEQLAKHALLLVAAWDAWFEPALDQGRPRPDPARGQQHSRCRTCRCLRVARNASPRASFANDETDVPDGVRNFLNVEDHVNAITHRIDRSKHNLRALARCRGRPFTTRRRFVGGPPCQLILDDHSGGQATRVNRVRVRKKNGYEPRKADLPSLPHPIMLFMVRDTQHRETGTNPLVHADRAATTPIDASLKAPQGMDASPTSVEASKGYRHDFPHQTWPA